MTTNANSKLISAILADARVGSFCGLVTTKKGAERGKGADKKVFGNDTVHTVILTGFRYERLVQRSLDALVNVVPADVVAKGAKYGKVFTEDDVKLALAELTDSYNKTLAGTNESTTDHVYESLVVNGEAVRGSRVYRCVKNPETDTFDACKCRDCTGEARAPKDGTIYLTGLRIFSKVLTPAPNGPIPAANSAAKTMAKDTITYDLPVSKFVQYALEPGTDFILNAGGTAAVEATKNGFVVNDDILDVLAKVA